MSRFVTFFATACILAGASVLPLSVAAADGLPTCNPACSKDQTCVFIGNTSQTQCITAANSNGTVEGITVTGANTGGMTFKDWVNNIIVPIGNAVIGLLFAVAFFLFIYGVFRFFFLQGEKGRESGKQFIGWGLIGLVVLFSVWGLVNLLLNTFFGSVTPGG